MAEIIKIRDAGLKEVAYAAAHVLATRPNKHQRLVSRKDRQDCPEIASVDVKVGPFADGSPVDLDHVRAASASLIALIDRWDLIFSMEAPTWFQWDSWQRVVSPGDRVAVEARASYDGVLGNYVLRLLVYGRRDTSTEDAFRVASFGLEEAHA
jgi:hypothetical protein